MARGKKTSEDKREQVKTLLYINPNATDAEIAKTVKLPNSTVHYIKKDVMRTDEFEEVRQRKKEEFINDAWETVKSLLLKVNDKILLLEGDDLKKANIRDIAIALGTIYDKQALASGEPTMISERQEPTPDLVKELEDKIKRLKQLTGS